MSAGLRSGQVAEAAGVNIQTLRYYERRGLLAEPERSNGGHRLYGEDAVTALRVIKAAQRLGFTLEEVAELLELLLSLHLLLRGIRRRRGCARLPHRNASRTSTHHGRRNRRDPFTWLPVLATVRHKPSG